MTHSKLAGILIAACVFATSQVSSAANLSASPYSCRLVNNTSPYTELDHSYGGFSDGKFWNYSGGYAWAMCPVAWQDGAYNFYIGGSSTTAACYLKATGTFGGGTTLYTGSRSGNYVYFYVPLTSGSYNAEIQCYLPNGTNIWGMLND